jgi:predicted ATPase/DNA-binding SARP family transcriptional activator
VGLELRILGPVEVVVGGEARRLGGRKQRALLALLGVHAGEVVSSDRIIEALWPAYDPAARKRLQVYISQLRKALGPGGAAVEWRADGYVLAIGPDAVDAGRFEALASAGGEAVRAGDPERAARTLREALDLWRGPALDDLASEPFAQLAGARLQELRLAALEDRVEADLALGRAQELVAELEVLVGAEPLRERLRGQLMLALYRCGRQADALEAYHAARRALLDELGLDPGPELRRLQQAILDHDPALLVEPAALRARRHLPAPATALIGRRAQLDELDAMLRAPGIRLVTLTGAGGAGKTRLAIQAAAELADRFEHGIFFVELAPLEDADLVAQAIAHAIGVEERADQPLTDSVQAHLRDRRLLLVLDNFEHVDEAAPLVSRLLAGAPALEVLVTSRSPLRLHGEHEYVVPPLEHGEAVDLFVARAQAVRRGFAGTGAVDQICAGLDGLPLAIELAAARTRTLSPEDMLASLPAPELAGEGPRDVPERQRTLRATLDWSHRLLDARGRELFASLAVFVGGFTAAAAHGVCGAGGEELAELVDQSLVVGGARHRMLETVREYALERLEEGGEADAVRGRHAQWFAALAEAGGEPEALEAEHANMRAALVWARESGAVEIELRLAGALAQFWEIRGYLREGRGHLEDALAGGAPQPGDLRAKALAGAAQLALRQGDYERFRAFATESLDLFRALGDLRGVARALNRLATAASNEGDHEGGAALYEQSAAICREIDDDLGLGSAVTNLGCLAIMQGDCERGAALSAEGLALYERAGERYAMLQPLFNLALAVLLQGRHDDAGARFAGGLRLARDLGYREGVIYFLEGLAAVHAATGEHERAAKLLGAAASAGEETGVSLEPLEREMHDRTVAAVVAALGEAGFAAAMADGRDVAPV